MRPLAALVLAGLAGLLAGCGGGGRPLTNEEYCQQQAVNDPQVKELIIKGVSNSNFQFAGKEQLQAAEQDATLACLRRRGVVPPGGVERQKAF